MSRRRINAVVLAMCMLGRVALVGASPPGGTSVGSTRHARVCEDADPWHRATDDAADLSLPTAASVDATPQNFSIYWQNDGTIIKPNHDTDRHYTNGGAVSFAYHPQWADWLADRLLGGPGADRFGAARTAAGFVAGQLIFTPGDTQTKSLIPNDEPYAGYLFAGAFWQRSDAHIMDQVRLDLGLVGPSALGGQVQNFVHRMRGYETAKGWNNQLHDEITGEAYFTRKWRFSIGSEEGFDIAGFPMQSQIIPQAKLAVGTVYRYADAAVLVRMGINLPDDFGPGELDDIAAATGKRTQGWSVYGFGRLGGRAVEHDVFLQGNTFRSSPGVDIKPLVGRMELGAALAYGGPFWTAQLAYSQTFFTKRFYGEDGTDAYGSLTVAVVGRF